MGEEHFAHHGEKLRRMFGGVGIDQRFVVAFHLGAESIKSGFKHLGPFVRIHAGAGSRQIIFTLRHVQLVGEFVDHDVVTVITRFGVLYITPGEHDAIAVDRKTGERAPALGHHPGVLVFEGLLDHELIGVQCDAVQRPIPIVRLAQGHKTGLRGDARAHRIVDL